MNLSMDERANACNKPFFASGEVPPRVLQGLLVWHQVLIFVRPRRAWRLI